MNLWEIFGISPPAGPYAAWDRESENVEDRRDSRLPAFASSAAYFQRPNEALGWQPEVEFDPEHPANQQVQEGRYEGNTYYPPEMPGYTPQDRVNGMIPPLGDFLSGKVQLGDSAFGGMYKLTPEYMDRVKKFEGWNPRAYPDYKQWSVGYGTRAQSPGEVIDRQEGERRLGVELQKAEGYVKGMGVPMSPRQQDALTDLTYNAGPGWQRWALGDAVRRGDWTRAQQLYQNTATTVNNGARVLPGLVNRRAQMAPWLTDTGGSEMGPQLPFFQEDPSQAPQGVQVPHGAPPPVGAQMAQQASMPRPAPPGTTPEMARQAWGNYFQAPEIQAAMLNMAIEAMRPRWNPGSMLPDMLSSGLRTISGQADYEDKLFKESAALHERELDRESRERIAEGRGDTALEVAGIRAQAQAENIRLRDSLKSSKLSPSEQLRFSAEVQKEKKAIMDSAFLSGQKISEAEAETRARNAVMERVASWRLAEMERTGQGQGGNSAGLSGPGRAAPQGTGGSPGELNSDSGASPGAGKTTPPNTALPSASELQRRMDSASPGNWKTWLMDPERRAALKQRVRDPEMIDAIYNQFVKQQGRLGAQ
jgi:lysozyme